MFANCRDRLSYLLRTDRCSRPFAVLIEVLHFYRSIYLQKTFAILIKALQFSLILFTSHRALQFLSKLTSSLHYLPKSFAIFIEVLQFSSSISLRKSFTIFIVY